MSPIGIPALSPPSRSHNKACWFFSRGSVWISPGPFAETQEIQAVGGIAESAVAEFGG